MLHTFEDFQNYSYYLISRLICNNIIMEVDLSYMYCYKNKDFRNFHVGMHCFHGNREVPYSPKEILEQKLQNS